MPLRQPRRAGLVLATGQTTQYSSEADDGFYQKGIAKRYEVLTAGAFAGTTNIDLAHYAGGAGNIDFVAATKKITDSGNGLAIFKTGDKIICSGPADPANIVILTVATGNVAGETVVTEVIADEAPAGVVTISKREAHSNACVLDNNTGLRWSRTLADKMGAASGGLMPWTGQLYDMYAYAAAANAASLAGYTDWRIPDDVEALGIMDQENRVPDSTAWPGIAVNTVLWTSTTYKGTTTDGVYVYQGQLIGNQAKTTASSVLLVRGG